ncbi:MAG: hypothetical protein M3P06_11725 [Acidobacteriota bacterium]|nr:hypothetical protein [Acidobacteriota bacterium]
MSKHTFHVKKYETRMDQRRAKYGIALLQWSVEAGIDRKVISRYRAGLDEPKERNLAKLVRAARKITGKQIRASEFFDLGEDEPLGTRRERQYASPGRKAFKTRFDQCLLREDVSPVDLARECGLSRQQVFKTRSGAASFSRPGLEKIVRGMRRLGRDVRASDIVDVGED